MEVMQMIQDRSQPDIGDLTSRCLSLQNQVQNLEYKCRNFKKLFETAMKNQT